MLQTLFLSSVREQFRLFLLARDFESAPRRLGAANEVDVPGQRGQFSVSHTPGSLARQVWSLTHFFLFALEKQVKLRLTKTIRVRGKTVRSKTVLTDFFNG